MAFAPDCNQSREWLTQQVADHLPPTDQAQLAAHLAQCPACQQEAAALGHLWAALPHLPVPAPSAQLRPHFYAMLAEQEAAAQRPAWPERLGQWLRPLVAQPAWRLAYSALLVAGGIAIGTQLQKSPPPAPVAAGRPVSAPAVAVAASEQQVILAGLASPSAMQRLQAVGQTRDLAPGNHKVAGALLRTLTQDPNVNVRLATLDALAPLGQDPVVRQGLVYALVRQESPLVQAALADVLVQLQLASAVPKLQALLRQPDLNPAVRTKLERSLHALTQPAAPTSAIPSAHEIRASHLPAPAGSVLI